MKRFLAGLAIAGAALAPFTASAHAPTFNIAGFQYTWAALIEEGGHANTINTPAGSLDISDVQPGGPVGNGASVGIDDADGISIVNYDRVPHTMTHCTAACDTAAPSATGATFDIAIEANGSAMLTRLPNKEWVAGTYTFFCKVHTWMSGSVRIS